MKTELRAESTLVQLTGGEDVEITPGQPWPSAYRGSKYSVVGAGRNNSGVVVKWEYEDLDEEAEPPGGLLQGMREVGKSGGTGRGSFRVTADGEVLTKVHADDYPRVDEAPVSKGWIPVYLGQLQGTLDFDRVDNDPEIPNNGDIDIWGGLPGNHGERWVVSGRKNLIWKWKDYRFQSAFDHSELVSRYQQLRRPAGRVQVNEHGQVFVNVSASDVPTAAKKVVASAYDQWQTRAERNGNTAEMRLVERRLEATSRTGEPEDGYLPVHIGHSRDFDGGHVPRPIVDDQKYFLVCGRKETW